MGKHEEGSYSAREERPAPNAEAETQEGNLHLQEGSCGLPRRWRGGGGGVGGGSLGEELLSYLRQARLRCPSRLSSGLVQSPTSY